MPFRCSGPHAHHTGGMSNKRATKPKMNKQPTTMLLDEGGFDSSWSGSFSEMRPLAMKGLGNLE
jgi:hypothetical protein